MRQADRRADDASDSASGVSMTRCSPKSFCRPSVTRNTPPSLPMSSPISTVLGSSSSARRSPGLMRLGHGRRSSVIGASSGEAGEVGVEVGALGVDQRVRLGVGVVEHRPGWTGRAGRARRRAGRTASASASCVELGEEGGVDQLLLVQEGPQPLDRVAQLPRLDVAAEPVARRVVGRGVRAHAVGERLDQRRAPTLPGPLQHGLGDRQAWPARRCRRRGRRGSRSPSARW